jgi:hypothetical protein
MMWSEEKKAELMAELELFGDRLIAWQIGMMEIIQQPAPLADHHQESTAGAMVLDVFLQMFGQMINALSQKSNLHVSGPCVALVQSEPCNRFSFFHILRSIFLMRGQHRFGCPVCKVLFSVHQFELGMMSVGYFNDLRLSPRTFA